MAVTALSGAISYAINGYTSLTAAILVGVGATLGGRVGAIYANKVSEKKLTKIVGLIFVILGVLMIIQQPSNRFSLVFLKRCAFANSVTTRKKRLFPDYFLCPSVKFLRILRR
jgi:putative Mn2+ efflux pump MntP